MRRRVAVALLLLAVAVAALFWLRRRPADARGASVLLVTIDTLRADRVGLYGARDVRTPSLDGLGAAGVVFEEALSSTPLTLPSHATILSGVEPPHHGVRDNGTFVFPSDRPTLATLLKAQGYATGAFVGAYVLDRRFGLARGFDEYDDRIERRSEGASVLESERRGEEVVAAASAWIERQAGPFFAWVHLYDPHAPYDPPSPYREQYAGRLYEGEVAYADACLGRLIAAAQARAGPKLIVAVLSDHGEGLGDHGEKTHGFFVYQSTLRVPFVLAGPGVAAGKRLAGPARTADVLPTIAGRLGVAPPPGLDGADLLDTRSRGPAYAETFYPASLGWAPLRAWRDGPLKLIEAPRPEMYDLAGDPAETRDMSSARPQELARLRQALAAFTRDESKTAAAPVPAEVAERLHALGYVAGGASGGSGGTGESPQLSLKDPKDALPLWQSFEEALWAESRGERDAAIGALRALVAKEPGNQTFRRSLAAALRRAGRAREALDALDAPRDALAWHERATVLAEAGNNDEAARAEREAIRLAPSLPEPHSHLGVLLAGQGRLDDALASFDEAIRLDPNNARAWNNRANVLRARGRRDEAAEAYRTAARLAPRDPDPVNGLGVLAVEAGDLERAASLFGQVLERHPEYSEASLNLAFVEARQGQADAARQRLRRLLQAPLDPAFSRRVRSLLQELDKPS